MQQYLEFNAETGIPIAVGPSKEKTSIEINDILANEIKSGSKRLEEFKVLYDEKLKILAVFGMIAKFTSFLVDVAISVSSISSSSAICEQAFRRIVWMVANIRIAPYYS